MGPAPQSNHHQSRIVANQFVYRATDVVFFAGTSDASKAYKMMTVRMVGVEQTLALLVHPTGFEPVTSAFGGLRTESFQHSVVFPGIPKAADLSRFTAFQLMDIP